MTKALAFNGLTLRVLSIFDAAKSNLGVSTEPKRELREALTRLREQQFAISVTVFIGVTPQFLVVANVVEAYYYMFLIPGYVETITVLGVFLSTSRPMWRNKLHKSTGNMSSPISDAQKSPDIQDAAGAGKSLHGSGIIDTNIAHSSLRTIPF